MIAFPSRNSNEETQYINQNDWELNNMKLGIKLLIIIIAAILVQVLGNLLF